MSEESLQGQDVSHVRDALLAAIVQCRERAAMGRRNEVKAQSCRKELQMYEGKLALLKECINYIIREYKSIERFLIDKKEFSMEMLKTAIEKAGTIVPDADAEGLKLKVMDKSARVLNAQGQDINLREGSAFRTVMGILMRYTLLKVQPQAVQMMLLDEAFATLSDETASVMREYLEAFKEDMLIVGIEQRNYLYDGIERIQYQVVKEGKAGSVVRRVSEGEGKII